RPRLRVPAESDVGGKGVLVAEEALDRIAVVDAVGARKAAGMSNNAMNSSSMPPQRRGWWNRSRPVRWRSAIVSPGISPDLGGRGALAQDGHERPGPTHRLVVVDVGEARARAIGHPRLPAV